jgi:hypothetical protein
MTAHDNRCLTCGHALATALCGLQQRASEQAEGTGGWDADALVVSELSELQLKG